MTVKEMKERLEKIENNKGVIIVSCGMMSAASKIVVDSDTIFIEGNIEQRELNHIERMELELKELQDKINKAEEFLYKENREPKFLDEKQKELLELQVSHMKHYYTSLKRRIEYDKNKEGVTKL